MNKKYIIVGVADEYYEEGNYIARFTNYKTCKDYLIKNKYYTFLQHLEYLESIKEKLIGDEIVISLW